MRRVVITLTLDEMLEIGLVETLSDLKSRLKHNEVDVTDSSVDTLQANEGELVELERFRG